MQLLIVGLDAADFEYCERFRDVMPNLSSIRAAGAYGRLESLEFPSTPPCWFSAHTGCLPDEHGIGGWRRKAMKDLKRKPFWQYLDCSVGLVNLPLVYHVGEEFDGFVVPGVGAPWLPYPTDLQLGDGYEVEAANVTQGQFTWLSATQKLTPKQVRRRQTVFLRLQREVETRRVEAVSSLIKRFPVDVLIVGNVMLDRIGHGFAHHEPTMRDAYRRTDILLGRLVGMAKAKNVVVFSDHGMVAIGSPRIPQTILDSTAKVFSQSALKIRLKGKHTLDGILAFSGPEVKRGHLLEGAEIRDVAPTLLRMLHVAVPDVMSGKTLKAAFHESENVDMLKVLRGLGYV